MDYETGKWLEKHDAEIEQIVQILIDKGLIPKPKEEKK